MELLNDYVSDEKIARIVEDQEMNYIEAAEYINFSFCCDFSEKTVGEHYRKYKGRIGERIKCKNCNDYFYVSQGHYSNFCSEECYEEYEKTFTEAAELENEKQIIHKFKEPWYKRAMDWIGETLS
jgi:hypothetical protein